MDSKIKLQVRGLSKIYEDNSKEVVALKDVNLEVKESEFVMIVGPSGCGKTSLINIIGGLDEASAGEVLLDGKSVSGPGADRGMVFQGYSLFPWLTVQKNVEFGLKMKKISPAERAEHARKYIRLVGLEGFEDALPRQLSGGMKRKLMVCRALLTSPEILLLDEPTAGMDALSRRQMWNLLRQLNGKNLTILLTTHYMEEAQSLCNRVALMDHGKLEEINTPSGLIDGLGKYTVDQETPEGAKSHYFHSREEAISFLSSLDGQCTLRETTLEDVFVERAGRHLMQR